MVANYCVTIDEILKKETQLYYEAESKYGDFFRNAANIICLLQIFIKEAGPMAWLFVMFLSQVKKHNMLALFSVVRLHHIQAMLNLRQVLEAGANAAYALENPKHDDFAKDNNMGIIDPSQKLARKRYEWLDKNYSAGSTYIKNMKNFINEECSHSNIIYALNNFGVSKNDNQDVYEIPFYDTEDEYQVKTDLWMIGDIAMELMGLFICVNKNSNLLTISDNFVKEFLDLVEINHQLKEEIKKHSLTMNF